MRGALLRLAAVGVVAAGMTGLLPGVASAATSSVTVKVIASDGTALGGVAIEDNCPGWTTIGTTDGTGTVSASLAEGPCTFRAHYHGTDASQSVTISGSTFEVDFQTTQAVIELKDSTGALTDGGVVQFGGGWPTIGTTGGDVTGTVYYEMFAGTHNLRMNFHGTTEYINQDISTPVVFQTTKAKIELVDHNGDPLNDGLVQFGGGWPTIGTTGDVDPGFVYYEMFPGTYNFRMVYNYTTQQLNGQDISSDVVFQTALVNLHFSGTIQHQVSGWPAYTGPLEMLPVAHSFGFSGPGHSRELLSITPTAGTVVEQTVIYTTVTASDSSALAGVPAQWWNDNGSATTAPGTTNASGHLLFAIDNQPTDTSVRVTYDGSQPVVTQNPQINSFYDFQIAQNTNEPPVSEPGGPYLGAITTAITFDGSGSWDPDGDSLTYSWDWGDGTTVGSGEKPTHTYTSAGIYNVCLTVTDPSEASDTECTSAVVYDPSGGFVTGGGWIDSPEGAYAADPSLTGKATFGFNAKYKKGATVPDGSTEFVFHAGNLNFHSTSYDWLVVAGSDAKFKGEGTVNGVDGYTFQINGDDGSPDQFRIQIWGPGNGLVYDNGPGEPIGGGSIIVHS